MRGRPRTPDELQRLKGNPRKRKLVRTEAPPPEVAQAAAPEDVSPTPASGEVTPAGAPEFMVPKELEHPREREIFLAIVKEFMPRNLVRETDFFAYTRYAHLMHLWLEAKEELAAHRRNGGSNYYQVESKHGRRVAKHPSYESMISLNQELRQMEVQLALTPMARTALLVRLRDPQAGAGPLFDPRSDDRDPANEESVPSDSALAYLQRAQASETMQ